MYFLAIFVLHDLCGYMQIWQIYHTDEISMPNTNTKF